MVFISNIPEAVKGKPSHSPYSHPTFLVAVGNSLPNIFAKCHAKEAPGLEEQSLRIRRVVQKSTTCEAEMKGPLRFRTMPLRFLVDLGISTDFLRVEFLMLQKLFALFFGNPRSWNFSYRAQPQHHRVPWFSWNFLVPKALSKKGTPRHSPQNFFTTLFPKVAIGDYAASHFGTMSMEAFRCLKIENLWVSRVLLRTRHRMRMQIPGWSCRRPWKLRLRPGPGKPHLSLWMGSNLT